ncbi:MAG TPA: hypothetical protein VFW09_09885 [Solirubrobacteraceae bacterium]|nr:hypothetical protein [Solirubrobacteraceae bacterium]
MLGGLVAAVALLLLGLGGVADAGAKTLPVIPKDLDATGADLVVKPGQIVFTGDGTGAIAGTRLPTQRGSGITWSSWTADTAHGTGKLWLNDCNPYCAGGTYHGYPVRLVAWKPGLEGGRLVFTRLTLFFTGDAPDGYPTDHYTFTDLHDAGPLYPGYGWGPSSPGACNIPGAQAGCDNIGDLPGSGSSTDKCMDVPVLGSLRISGDCFAVKRSSEGWELVLESGKTVDISGLTLTTPSDGELAIVVAAGQGGQRFGALKEINAKKGVDVSLGGVQLGRQKFAWKFPSGTEGAQHDVGTGPDSAVKGLKLTGSVSLGFEEGGKLTATANATLGGEFGEITGEVKLESANPGGLKLSDLEVKLANTKIPLGPLTLQSAGIKFEPPDKWTGSAQVQLPGEVPGEGAQIKGSLTLLVNDGGVQFSGASLDGSNLNIAIGPDGVFLQEVGGSLALHPLVIKGTIGVTAGPELSFAGGKYSLLSLKDSFGYTDENDANKYTMNGSATMLNEISIGQFDAAFVPGQGFAASGQLGYQFGPVGVDARINGWIGHGQFDFDGDGHISLPLLGADGHIVVSSDGIAACAGVKVLWHTFEAGMGYHWGGSFNVFDGCNLAPYQIPAPEGVPKPSAADGAGVSSTGSRAIRLKASKHATMVAVHGAHTAPAVRVAGPHGATIAPGARGAAYDPKFAYLLESPRQKETFVVLAPHRHAARYTFTRLGAERISAIKLKPRLPAPKVRATVSAHTIRFRARRIKGQRLRFVEQGGGVGRAIATTRANHGRIHFTPHPGGDATRRIKVIVLEHGLPRTVLTVAKYRYRYQRPSRPAHVRIARHGKRVRVSWRHRGWSAGFRVRLRTSSGQRLLAVAGPHAHRVRFTGVRGRRTKATVVAVGLHGGNSRTASASRGGSHHHGHHRRHRHRHRHH